MGLRLEGNKYICTLVNNQHKEYGSEDDFKRRPRRVSVSYSGAGLVINRDTNKKSFFAFITESEIQLSTYPAVWKDFNRFLGQLTYSGTNYKRIKSRKEITDKFLEKIVKECEQSESLTKACKQPQTTFPTIFMSREFYEKL